MNITFESDEDSFHYFSKTKNTSLESNNVSVLHKPPPNTCATSVRRNLFVNYCDTPDNSISTIGLSSTNEIKQINVPEATNITESRASYSTSWIIDMSENLDTEDNTLEIKKTSETKKGSCFYVDLNDGPEETSREMKNIFWAKKSPNRNKQQDIKSKSVNIPCNNETTALSRLLPDLDKDLVTSTSSYKSSPRVSANVISNKKHSYSAWSLIECCESELGKRLLKMFLEESGTDIAVEVSGRKIRAHSYILEFRCQYFAGVLGGSYVQSAGNIIILPTYTYNVVHYAICNIYSGVSYIPPTLDIVELAALVDMLGLDSLKDAVSINLETKYCHNFHNPCDICITGVLKCLHLSFSYGLEELLNKCIAWTTIYFYLLWPTPRFNSLPHPLKKKCYQHHIIHFSLGTLLEKLNGCSTSVSGLPNSRWASPIKVMIKELVADLADLVALKLIDALEIILNDIHKIPQASIETVNTCISIAIKKAPFVQVAFSYDYLEKKFEMYTIFSRDDTWLNILNQWSKQCRSVITSQLQENNISTNEFNELPDNLKVKINELGYMESSNYLTYVTKPKQTRKYTKETLKLDIMLDQVKSTITAYAENLTSRSRTVSKTNNPPFTVRMNKAQLNIMKYRQGKVQNKNGDVKLFDDVSKSMEKRQADNNNAKLHLGDKVIVNTHNNRHTLGPSIFFEPIGENTISNSSETNPALLLNVSKEPPPAMTVRINKSPLKIKYRQEKEVKTTNSDIKLFDDIPGSKSSEKRSQVDNKKNKTKLSLEDKFAVNPRMKLEPSIFFQPIVKATSTNSLAKQNTNTINTTKQKTPSHSRSNPKMDIPPAYSVRMTKAQMERMKYNRNISQAKEFKKTSKHVKTPKFENTKSRYMELRRPQADIKDCKNNQASRIFEQSSETMSLDSLATNQASSESHISNRFGTYTRTKKAKFECPVGPQVKKPGATRIPIAKVYQRATPEKSCAHPEYRTPLRIMLPVNCQSSAAAIVHQTIVKTKITTPNTKSETFEVIPVMERSGTFSKDEPTFADRTAEIE